MDADKFALVNRNALCQSADINLICCYNVSDKAGFGIESYRAAVVPVSTPSLVSVAMLLETSPFVA